MIIDWPDRVWFDKFGDVSSYPHEHLGDLTEYIRADKYMELEKKLNCISKLLEPSSIHKTDWVTVKYSDVLAILEQEQK